MIFHSYNLGDEEIQVLKDFLDHHLKKKFPQASLQKIVKEPDYPKTRADVLFISNDNEENELNEITIQDLRKRFHYCCLIAIVDSNISQENKEIYAQWGINLLLQKPFYSIDLKFLFHSIELFYHKSSLAGNIEKQRWPELNNDLSLHLENNKNIDKDLRQYIHKLKNARAYLETVNDSLGVIIIISNWPDCRIEYANKFIEKTLNVKLQKALKENITYIFPDQKSFHNFYQKIETAIKGNESGINVEHSLRHVDGKEILVENHISFIYQENGEIKIVCAMRDITEKKKILSEREKLITAIEQAGEAIVITDTEGSIQYVNPAFESITGYTSQEARGNNPRILKSGRQDENFYATLWNTIKSGKSWQGHFVNKRKDGSLYHEMSTISPVFNDNRELTNFVAVKKDISEETKLKDKLRQAQKLEAIGTLAGGIAHDFNNILYIILGYANLIHDLVEESSPVHKSIMEIKKAGERGVDLVKQILSFSKTENDTSREKILLPNLLTDIVHLLSGSYHDKFDINLNIDKKCSSIFANKNQIYQVILNLLTNAYQAIPKDGGLINVELKPAKKEGQDYALLVIQDNGPGIAEDDLSRIFEPYFTTKNTQEGTGLGLSIVHSIINSHKGYIDVRSQQGEGTIFYIYIPSYMQEMDNAKIDNKHRTNLDWAIKESHKKILFVDDERQIITLLSRLLQKRGFRVDSFSNPSDAWKTFQQNPLYYDMLITDQSMPEMTGVELIKNCLTLNKNLPVILCTGYNKNHSAIKQIATEKKALMLKPIDFSEMLDKMEKFLD